MPAPIPIRVAFAEDHPRMQAHIRDVLASDPGLVVIAEASTGSEMLTFCRSDPPDIILLDLHMHGPGPVEMVQTLRREVPRSPVLIVTSEDDDVFVIAMARLGVRGYIVKGQMEDELLPGIHAIMSGSLWYAPGFDIK